MRWRGGWGSTSGSGRSSCGRGLATGGPAFPKMSPPSSHSPATPSTARRSPPPASRTRAWGAEPPMQALVLAGGEGTRLRPLTLTVPKPVMPLAGRPFLTFMLDWLRGHGVDDVLLSCGFLAHAVEGVLGDEYNGVRLRYVHEDEPLGTAGPVRLAADEGLLQDRVFILNGDVLTDMDLTAQLAFHEEKGAKASLA